MHNSCSCYSRITIAKDSDCTYLACRYSSPATYTHAADVCSLSTLQAQDAARDRGVLLHQCFRQSGLLLGWQSPLKGRFHSARRSEGLSTWVKVSFEYIRQWLQTIAGCWQFVARQAIWSMDARHYISVSRNPGSLWIQN